jgi:hypothetical protein
MTLGGGFKQFWEQRGGLAEFGYPISQELQEGDPAAGPPRTVQYFERARLELHPEQQGAPGEIQLGLVGREVVKDRVDEAAFQPLAPPDAATASDALYFGATGHTLNGVFRRHWEATGGAERYGLPISEPLMERWRGNVPGYTVQYFERARMEHHPEMQDVGREVWLGRLGAAVFVRRPPPGRAPSQ